MHKSKIEFIRHGRTDYTEVGLDLTETGIAETRRTARELAPELEGYDEIWVISSPQARALGTAQVFLGELGLNLPVETNCQLRCLDIHNKGFFDRYFRRFSTQVYGQALFNNPAIAGENVAMESREEFGRRAHAFLIEIVTKLREEFEAEGKSVCVLAFTHFEIATNYLRPLYDESCFPDAAAAGIANSEAVQICLEPDAPGMVTVQARGQKVTLPVESRQFNPEFES